MTTASSHRIGKLTGAMNSSWRIIAAHVEQPDQGVILRWRKRTGVQSSVYLCVKAKADPDAARGLDGDEICIDMAVQERVDMKAESNIIIEFFFSASGVAKRNVGFQVFAAIYPQFLSISAMFLCYKVLERGGHGRNRVVFGVGRGVHRPDTWPGSKGYPPEGGYEPTGKDLKCQYSYRFQVEGYNHNQELVAVSDWSNEVYIKPRSLKSLQKDVESDQEHHLRCAIANSEGERGGADRLSRAFWAEIPGLSPAIWPCFTFEFMVIGLGLSL